ncbi:MAG: pyridoxal phosphate-dependent aminotransferase [Deltaproteobacteria bacterium]
MQNLLSKRVSQLQPSATLAISAKARELKSQGVDVVGFGAGEPDFATPAHIREAAKKSLDRGETFYTPVGGTADMKKAVIQRFADDYALEYKPEEILVSCGAKHSLYNIFQALISSGDEVIITAPYWVSYPEMVELADGVPVIVPTSDETRFLPDPDEVESRISPRTKAIVINSPANPTGVLYPDSVLEALAALAEKHDLLVISDDIYDKLIYEGGTFTPFASLPGMKERTIVVNGVSKTYAMTGFRIGYLASTRVELVKAATNIQGQSTSNPSSPAQAAAVEALTGPQDEVGRMREIFERRRNLMIEEIGKIEGISAVKPEGAFYAFVNVRGLYRSGNVANSSDMVRFLLETQHVACVPGVPFGSDDHVRLSFATDDETILKGMERIGKAIRELA